MRGSGDRALQECNPSTGSPVDCESILSRFELAAGPGFFFGVPLQATVKAKNSSFLSGRQAAVVFLIAKPITAAGDGDDLGLLEETI